ncbi:MAG TPA: hypothetical protein VFB78_10895 [Acidimicrobiales bacterium]|nr:hypothetical protein [Acidimicrobiales bacterium]
MIDTFPIATESAVTPTSVAPPSLLQLVLVAALEPPLPPGLEGPPPLLLAIVVAVAPAPPASVDDWSPALTPLSDAPALLFAAPARNAARWSLLNRPPQLAPTRQAMRRTVDSLIDFRNS